MATPSSNGPGAAALLATGLAAFALPGVAMLADRVHAVARWMTFYRPTGPLSGVSTSVIVLWLAAWRLLHWRWRQREVNLAAVSAAAFALLLLGFLFTFPPLADLI